MRDRIIIVLSAIAASFVVSWVEEYRRTGVSVQAHLWHDIMVQSHKTAHTIGRLGIYAENRYQKEVTTHVG